MVRYLNYLPIFVLLSSYCFANKVIDICGVNSDARYYLEYEESGVLVADFQNSIPKNKYNISNQLRCNIEFITCPSCVIELKFLFINISRSCGKSPVYENCGCNFVIVYEPPFEDISGKQFCGRYVQNHSADISYRSLTRNVAIGFTFTKEYGHAFTLEYKVERNTIHYKGQPRISNMNNASQYISTPFFPYLYPTDLSVEYVIYCDIPERCRISLLFTDFLLADSSMIENLREVITKIKPQRNKDTKICVSIKFHASIHENTTQEEIPIWRNNEIWHYKPCFEESTPYSIVRSKHIGKGRSLFFDWNGQRLYVTSGSAFRPPVIVTSGPALVVRFYANGGSDYGFKASYMFILGQIDDSFTPSIGCGGHVNNLGGGIIMTSMVPEATKLFDCIWLIKPPQSFLHRKTHLYLKVVNFSGLAGNTELIVRQGLTSIQPPVEILRYPMSHHTFTRQNEHVVPISQGFYVSLKGLFRPESNVVIVYSTFNYKDCFEGSDFICHNLRCVPSFLKCDGLDHCGDSSDETKNCSQDPRRDHREFSKIPNFLFPKIDPYSDLTAATLVFIMCSFGLIGIILVMALLLYRVNMRARHQRQIQDHIETIHAILEETVDDVVEEIIVPDDPPDYEPPPEYSEVLKLQKYLKQKLNKKCHRSSTSKTLVSAVSNESEELTCNSNSRTFASTSRSCQTTPIKIPESPPPAYENVKIMYENLGEGHSEENEETLRVAVENKCFNFEEAVTNSSAQFNPPSRSRNTIPYFTEIEAAVTRNISSKNMFLRLKKCSSDEYLSRYFSESVEDNSNGFYLNCNDKSQLRKSFSLENVFDF